METGAPDPMKPKNYPFIEIIVFAMIFLIIAAIALPKLLESK